mmetsp:Transcript_20704/g.44125  ORF Transcript_20704/g.44125 Transcript_20704/m.44125 type:complete len:215 (-) Transcript_20704:584-1228(-)
MILDSRETSRRHCSSKSLILAWARSSSSLIFLLEDVFARCHMEKAVWKIRMTRHNRMITRSISRILTSTPMSMKWRTICTMSMNNERTTTKRSIQCRVLRLKCSGCTQSFRSNSIKKATKIATLKKSHHIITLPANGPWRSSHTKTKSSLSRCGCCVTAPLESSEATNLDMLVAMLLSLALSRPPMSEPTARVSEVSRFTAPVDDNCKSAEGAA